MSHEPHEIAASRVIALVRELGIQADPVDIRSVLIEPQAITVAIMLRNEQGRHYLAAPDEIATQIVTIKVVGG